MSSLFIELSSDEETFAKIIENFAQFFLAQKDSDDLVSNQDFVDEFTEKANEYAQNDD